MANSTICEHVVTSYHISLHFLLGQEWSHVPQKTRSSCKSSSYTYSKRQRAVLVYGQQAVFRSSMYCGKQHTVAASTAAKAVHSNHNKFSKQQQHKQRRVPTACSSDTQVLLLQVTTTPAAWGLRQAAATHYCTAVCCIQQAVATVPGTYKHKRVRAYVHQYTFVCLD